MKSKVAASRRTLLKWGLCGLGTVALTTLPRRLAAQLSGAKTLTFNADDVGIINFALLLEELEAAFYAAVLKSNRITDTKELDYIKALGAHEASHAKLLRQALGSSAVFEAPELSFNPTGLGALLRDRDSILNAAVTLEDVGVHAYNGAGPSLKNPAFLLAAGSIVSVEARHAAGVRALLQRPTTEPDSDRAITDSDLVADNPFRGRAYDELYTPKQIVAIVDSLNVINNPIAGALVA